MTPNDDDSPIASWGDWPTNGHLIADVAELGWLKPTDRILDPTWGIGVFWTEWQPVNGKLIGTDLNPEKSPTGKSIDFTNLPFKDGMFDAVVFDPPYKLNGTPDPEVDARYGVDGKVDWKDRMDLIAVGVRECARVSRDRLLVKCMDQVCSGQVRWQTKWVTDAVTKKNVATGELSGWRLADRFDMIGHSRKQPAGRTQKHSYGRGSTLLVFVKGQG